MAKAMLDKAAIEYTVLDAEENTALAIALDIRQAPTLVAVNGGEAEKYVNVQNVKKYISER